MKKLLVLLLGLLLLTLAGCGGSSPSEKKTDRKPEARLKSVQLGG